MRPREGRPAADRGGPGSGPGVAWLKGQQSGEPRSLTGHHLAGPPAPSPLPSARSPLTPSLRPIPATHSPGKEVSLRPQPGSPASSGVTFCGSKERTGARGGRQPAGVKDEAPGSEGGRRRLSARVPRLTALPLLCAEAASPAGHRHHPGATGVPGARRCHSPAAEGAVQTRPLPRVGIEPGEEDGQVAGAGSQSSSRAPGFARHTPSALLSQPLALTHTRRMQWSSPGYGKRREPRFENREALVINCQSNSSPSTLVNEAIALP